MDHQKPRLLCSKCLGFGRCRYNGDVIPAPFVEKLGNFCDITAVCPEVEIGLGVPRKPIRIMQHKTTQRLIQPETGTDVTLDMVDFSRRFLGTLGEVHGFLLKYKSPSCGLFSAKYYPEKEGAGASGSGPGFFGRAVLERFPGYPAETEKRLTNFEIRDHFLIRLFTLSRFETLQRGPDAKSLVHFQASNKLLFLAHREQNMREMGRLVAAQKEAGLRTTLAAYKKKLLDTFRVKAPHQSHLNVLQHAAGYFSKHITVEERNYLNELLDQYREHRIPLSAIRSVIRSYIIRFDIAYLKEQTYFSPYPDGLVEVTDSGKGRNLKHL